MKYSYLARLRLGLPANVLETGIPLNPVVAKDVFELAQSLGLCDNIEAFQDILV